MEKLPSLSETPTNSETPHKLGDYDTNLWQEALRIAQEHEAGLDIE